MTERTGPLSDVRILDLTQALAGPFGTAVLADLGADVIKVEPPTGDLSRPMAPLVPDFAPPGSSRAAGCDYGGYFASINRNKRSIVLDLRKDEDRERFLDLAVTVDAVVENSRVGVMGLWELSEEDYERMFATNVKACFSAANTPYRSCAGRAAARSSTPLRSVRFRRGPAPRCTTPPRARWSL